MIYLVNQNTELLKLPQSKSNTSINRAEELLIYLVNQNAEAAFLKLPHESHTHAQAQARPKPVTSDESHINGTSVRIYVMRYVRHPSAAIYAVHDTFSLDAV